MRTIGRRRGLRGLIAIMAVEAMCGGTLHAASGTWLGTSNAAWTVNANWSGTNYPAVSEAATFNGAGSGNTAIAGNPTSLARFVFDTADCAAYSFAGSFTFNTAIGNGIDIRDTVLSNQTFNGALTFGGDSTVNTFSITNNGAGALSLNGSLGSGGSGKTLRIGGSGAIFAAGTVGHAASTALVKFGAGTVTLSGTNTFGGGVTVSNGILRVTQSAGLGSGTKTFLNSSGYGTLELDGSGGNISLAGTISLYTSGAQAAGVVRNIAGTNSIQGLLTLGSGAGNSRLVSAGGSLTLSGGVANITAARSLLLDGPASGEVSGPISEKVSYPISIEKHGSGTWTLSGVNLYSGVTTVSNGVLRVVSGALSPVTAVRLASPGQLQLDFAGTNVVSALYTNGVPLAEGAYGPAELPDFLTGSGALLVTQVSTSLYWTGSVSTNWGDAGNWSSTQDGLTPAGQTPLVTQDVVFNADGAGGSDIQALGADQAARTLLFSTNVAACTITDASRRLVLGAGEVTVGSNVAATLNCIVAGSAGLWKSGAGMLTLGGANVYSGGTTVSNGMLRAGSTNALGAGVAVTVADGATLDMNAQNLQRYAVTISGSGVGGGGAVISGVADQIYALTNLVLAADASVGGTMRWDLRSGTPLLDLAGHTLTKVGTNGVVVVGGRVTSGDIVVNDGFLGFHTAPTLCLTGGTITVASAGALEVYSTAGTNITRSVQLAGGTLRSLQAAGVNSAITLTSRSTVSTPANLTLGGAIGQSGGTFGFDKTEAGTLSLAAGSTFGGGISIQGGTVAIGADSALGAAPATVTPSNLVINGGSLSLVAGFEINANRGIALGAGGGALAYSGAATATYLGAIQGSGALTLSSIGGAQWVIGGASTYTGGTTLGGAGEIVVKSNSAGPAGNPTSGPFGAGPAPLVLAGATLRSTTDGERTIGNAVVIASNTTFTTYAAEKRLTFLGPMTITNGTKTLTVNIGATVAGTVLWLGGAIGDDGHGYGLTLAGSGITVFGGTNTYSGVTTLGGTGLAIPFTSSTAAGGPFGTGALTLGGSQIRATTSTAVVLSNAVSFAANTAVPASVPAAALTFAGPVTLAGGTRTLTQNAGANVTFSGGIGDGTNVYGFVKAGTGTVVLAGMNTYDGGTAVSNGTLVVSGTLGTGTVTVAGTATLAGGGSIGGSVSDSAGSRIVVGADGGPTATLAIGGDLTLAGSDTLRFDLAGTNSLDRITVGGSLAPGGVTSIQVAGSIEDLPPGQYPLIDVAGTLGGSAARFSAGSNPVSRLTTWSIAYQTGSVPNQVMLDVSAGSGVSNLVWKGSSNLWDVGTTRDWTDGGADDCFYHYDNVQFDGAGVAQSNVSLVVAVKPGAVTVDTSLGNYSISGAGRISGAGGLRKTGAGTLTLTTSNDYSGGTLIENGTLQIGAGGTVGSVAGAVTNNGTLAFYRSDALTVSNVIGGAGQVVKLGANVATLISSNSYDGQTTVAGGVLIVANNRALGSSVGSCRVQDTAALRLAGGMDVEGETITISGGGSSVAGNYNGALQAAANGTAVWGGTVFLADAMARVGAETNGTLTISGDIQDSGGFRDLYVGAGTGAGSGKYSGTVVLTGPTKTYSGRTSVVRGVLRLGHSDVLPAATVLDVDYSSAIETAVFDLAGFDQTIGGLQRSNIAGGSGGSFVMNSALTVSTLTINQATDLMYSGVIRDQINLVKAGVGILALSGPCAYTGSTTVEGGTLILNSACLAQDKDVYLTTGSYLNLNFAGENPVGRLVIDGSERPSGVYNAGNTSQISGTGSLRVTNGRMRGAVMVVR